MQAELACGLSSPLHPNVGSRGCDCSYYFENAQHCITSIRMLMEKRCVRCCLSELFPNSFLLFPGYRLPLFFTPQPQKLAYVWH